MSLPAHNQLSDARIAVISDLVSQIAYQARGFKVYPAKTLTDDPSILNADDAIERLADSTFWLRLADGKEELLTLPELLALAYNLYSVRSQLRQAMKDLKQKNNVRVAVNFDVREMMKPENGKPLLSSIRFEGIPRERP